MQKKKKRNSTFPRSQETVVRAIGPQSKTDGGSYLKLHSRLYLRVLRLEIKALIYFYKFFGINLCLDATLKTVHELQTPGELKSCIAQLYKYYKY